MDDVFKALALGAQAVLLGRPYCYGLAVNGEQGLQDVVENLGNASLIAAAFASGEYERLRGAFVDRLHQPFREKYVPFLSLLLAAAADAGALGGFLSGSGSTVACIALSDGKEVASALEAAAPEENARILIVSADNDGARVI